MNLTLFVTLRARLATVVGSEPLTVFRDHVENPRLVVQEKPREEVENMCLQMFRTSDLPDLILKIKRSEERYTYSAPGGFVKVIVFFWSFWFFGALNKDPNRQTCFKGLQRL